MLNEAIKQVSVFGAAGKMGRGIALLLLQEMVRVEAELTGGVGSGSYCLHLNDINNESLHHLQKHLSSQLQVYAERNINRFRKYFSLNSNLVSNGEIIEAVVTGGNSIIHLDTEITTSKKSNLIFEAIIEDINLKLDLFSKLKDAVNKDAFFFSNTSSIPIHYLAEKSGLENRMIGYHFYNPPTIQKLLEVIIPKGMDQKLKHLSEDLAKRLGKIVVYSEDIAGFIGNGHLIREVDYASAKVKELEKEYGKTSAIVMIDQVTRDFLIRPMGIFQLIDYVGIDVCQKIMSVMSQFLHIPFQTSLIEEMIKLKKVGGQNADGSQKEGIFQYSQRNPIAVFDLQSREYIPLPKISLGEVPVGHASWKHLVSSPEKEEKLKNYFFNLFSSHSFGATIAQEFLRNSRRIGQNLVKDGVAKSIEDVDTVLINGFYHLYGVDKFLKTEGLTLDEPSPYEADRKLTIS